MDVKDERDQSADSGQKRGSHGVLATVCGAGVVVAACLLALIPTLQVLGRRAIPVCESALGRPPRELPHRPGHASAHFSCCRSWFFPRSRPFTAPTISSRFAGRNPLRTSWFFFATFVAGMIMVLIARTALLFLVSWEAMSLSAYFLVTFEHEKEEVRRAGWIYLVAAHLGVAFLFATFFLLGRQAGGLDFDAFSKIPAIAAGPAGLIFVSALIGFGAKAGFVPFHVWLPEAHPAAPSHVSALMSGVMIKMGLYGLLRVVSFIGPPAPWWGLSLGALGLLTALVGISLALYQRDMKRVLAYSSIENMGLIGLALGVGLFGSATGHSAVAVLGTSAGLLHIWNHALMKCLMFFAAGSVLHGTGTKDLEKLGGVAKRMPWTGVSDDHRGGGDFGTAALEWLRQQVALVPEPDEVRFDNGWRPRPDGLAGGRCPRPGRRLGGDRVRASDGNRTPGFAKKRSRPPRPRVLALDARPDGVPDVPLLGRGGPSSRDRATFPWHLRPGPRQACRSGLPGSGAACRRGCRLSA